MLSEVKRISDLSDEVLIPEIRKIHQHHGTSEYINLIDELPSLQASFRSKDLGTVFASAKELFQQTMSESLAPYPGVIETLSTLRSKGILIVVYTDSLAYYTNYRLRRLGLDSLVDYLFSPPDHELPAGVNSEADQLVHAKHVYLPKGVRKPDRMALLDIVDDVGRAPPECIYLGDSLKNDIAMAQDARIEDVYAKYGAAQGHPGYAMLQKVSHWPEVDVQRETQISERVVKPTHTINQFSDIVRFFGE